MSANKETPVNSTISATKKEFENLINKIKQSDYKYNEVVERNDWEHQLGSFDVWTHNIGFCKSNRYAVDSRIIRYDSLPSNEAPKDATILGFLEDLRVEVRVVQDHLKGTSFEDTGG